MNPNDASGEAARPNDLSAARLVRATSARALLAELWEAALRRLAWEGRPAMVTR